MACDSKSHPISWYVISVKLNIGKKITGIKILTLNQEKIWHVSKLIEVMFKGNLYCLQGCFKK